MWELWMHLDYDHLYIPLTSKWRKFQLQAIIFLVKKAYCWVGQDFWKKKIFLVWDLVTTGKQIEKTTYFATEKILQNFEGHDSWHYSYKFFQSGWDVVEIMELDATSKAYSRLKMRSTIERCPLLQKLHKVLFRYKTLR